MRSLELGDLRANGKLAGLVREEEPCTYFGTDDDISYPGDYCDTLEGWIERLGGDVVVGVHAAVLRAPVTSYVDRKKVLHRRSGQSRPLGVDLLGSDSIAFRTTTLGVDVREWPEVNMVDPRFALEARRRNTPLVMIPRPAHWLVALDENQDDSIWTGVLRDDSRQTELARELVELPRPRLPRDGWRRLSYRSV